MFWHYIENLGNQKREVFKMLEDIDDWLFKWANQCEPIREKCIYCDNTDCQWWEDFNEESKNE